MHFYNSAHFVLVLVLHVGGVVLILVLGSAGICFSLSLVLVLVLHVGTALRKTMATSFWASWLYAPYAAE